jgi:DNA polymerase-3 subunit delta'
MFENILGQQRVKKILLNQITSGKIAPTYIFMGHSGVGKRCLASEFAKILNCTVNDFTQIDIGACGKCLSCEKINKNIHPDVHFIDFEKQSELDNLNFESQKVLKVETIRYMQKAVRTKIHEGKWKVFVVEPVEKMNTAAANSLLKILEEPPQNTVVVLIAEHKETVLRTVISRSQILFFHPLLKSEISSWLMLNYSLSSAEAKKISELSDGSLEVAKKLVEKKESVHFSLWNELKTQNFYISDVLELSRYTAKSGALECVDAMIIEVKNDFRINPQKIFPVLKLLNVSRSLLLKNVNSQIVLDNLFFGLLDFKNGND